MSDWSPEETIAMERRHILEGAKRVSRQEALVGQLIENGGPYQFVHTANEVLCLLRESLGPVDKPVLAPARPELVWRCSTDVATGVTS
jgi:hypothetical protein